MSATGRGAPAQSATADREIVISRIEMRTVFPTKELRDEAVEKYHSPGAVTAAAVSWTQAVARPTRAVDTALLRAEQRRRAMQAVRRALEWWRLAGKRRFRVPRRRRGLRREGIGC